MSRNNHEPMRWVQGDSEGKGSLPARRGTWSRNWKKDIVSSKWAVQWEVPQGIQGGLGDQELGSQTG